MARRIAAVTAAVLMGTVLAAWAASPPDPPTEGETAAKPKPNPDVPAVAKGGNEFALDLYARLAGSRDNLFFAPGSIHPALAMTYAGAGGQTAEQMAKVLRFTLPAGRLNPAFADLTRRLNAPEQADAKKRPYELVVANALWGQQGFPFRKEFLETTGRFYGARLTELDFKTASEPARRTINAWIEKQTNEKIKDLIPGGVLNEDTRLVLTNAVYFKGKWASPFTARSTRDRPFHLLTEVNGSRTVQAPTMHKPATTFGYVKADGMAAVELPYAGEELSMVVLLPDRNDGLAELEKKLTAENLGRWLGQLRRREVEVLLPKFKMTCQFSLKRKLEAMGMAEAFSDSADFTGMVEGGGLKITDVIHKAFVDVNEEGTEAAGATAVVVGVTSVMPERPPLFNADHPFVFLIRHKPTGLVLFLGRVTNPKA